MPKYRFRATATVEVEAENVAQAMRVARRVRLFPWGRRVGGTIPPNNRDAVMYSIEAGELAVRLIREGD